MSKARAAGISLTAIFFSILTLSIFLAVYANRESINRQELAAIFLYLFALRPAEPGKLPGRIKFTSYH